MVAGCTDDGSQAVPAVDIQCEMEHVFSVF